MSENQSSEKPEATADDDQTGSTEEKAADEAAVEPSPTPGRAELKRLLNIEIPIIAVMAEKTMKLKDILNLTIGSIIQLNKPADENLDLMVNNQRIGQGQTVRVGDNFGLQITQLNPVRDTIRKLGRKPETPEAPSEAGATEPAPEGESAEEPDTSTDS